MRCGTVWHQFQTFVIYGQLHFAIWTNAFDNFGQIQFAIGTNTMTDLLQHCNALTHAGPSGSIWTTTFSNLEKYILQLWTNTICNLDKYNDRFIMYNTAVHWKETHAGLSSPIWTTTFSNLEKYILQLWTNIICNLDKYYVGSIISLGGDSCGTVWH